MTGLRVSEQRLIDVDKAMDIKTLYDWYIISVLPSDEPVWTDNHIEELFNDFYVIPKDAPTIEAEKTELKEKIAKIADTYGYDAQSRQCIEEMAELMQAINKAWREWRTDKEMTACMDNLVEEIADVQIMLWQMEYLLQADLMPIIDQKLDRQLERMKENGR